MVASELRWAAQQRRVGRTETFTVYFAERPTASQMAASGIEPGSLVDLLAVADLPPIAEHDLDWDVPLA